jgi:integrase
LLTKITNLDISAFYAAKLARGRLDGKSGLSARMVHHFDRLLRLALEDAVRGRLIAFNPVTHAKRPKVAKATKRTPSDGELSTLLATAADGPLYAPIVLILTTGMRRGELLALCWRNIDLDGARLQIVEAVEETKAGIRLKEPKTEAGRRRIDLPGFAVEALRKHQVQQKQDHLAIGLGWTLDTLVFPNPEGELQRPRTFTKAVARLAAKAGVKFSPHLGRHDHFTRLLAAGVHPKVAQVRAGHSSVAVTIDVYSNAIDALQKDAAERTQNMFVEIRKVAGGNPVAKPVSLHPSKS